VTLLPPPEEGQDGRVEDDLLRLLFTCCHPALERPAQVALALKWLCGLSTGQVGRLLLVPEAAMARRLSRARQKIAVARIPYRVPAAAQLPERVSGGARDGAPAVHRGLQRNRPGPGGAG